MVEKATSNVSRLEFQAKVSFEPYLCALPPTQPQTFSFFLSFLTVIHAQGLKLTQRCVKQIVKIFYPLSTLNPIPNP